MNFVLREEVAFLFQTFSRNDLPGEAPPSRGRSVFKKRGKNVNVRCANVRRFRRSRKMLPNEHLLANVGFDTTENELSKVFSMALRLEIPMAGFLILIQQIAKPDAFIVACRSLRSWLPSWMRSCQI